MHLETPLIDGESLLRVGSALMAATLERPELGLALARERAHHQPGHWFVDTRVATAAGQGDSDVRFSAFTPLLRDLALKVAAGDFTVWFADIKDGWDSGRLHPVATMRGRPEGLLRARLAEAPAAEAPAAEAPAAETPAATPAPTPIHPPAAAAPAPPPIETVTFENVAKPTIRTRGTRH